MAGSNHHTKQGGKRELQQKGGLAIHLEETDGLAKWRVSLLIKDRTCKIQLIISGIKVNLGDESLHVHTLAHSIFQLSTLKSHKPPSGSGASLHRPTPFITAQQFYCLLITPLGSIGTTNRLTRPVLPCTAEG